MRRRPWKRYGATVAIIVGGLYTGYHYSYGTETPPVEPPAAGTANIWVDTTGGSCADSTSAISYPNNATECATLAAAVAAAEAGDKIAIRLGAYPFETLAYRANLQNLSPACDPYGEWGTASTANCIEIVPDGGDVWIRGAYNHASSIWFHGNVTGDDGAGGGNPQAFRNRTYDFHISKSDLIGNPPPGADDDANCNCASAQFRAARPIITSTDATRPDHVIVDGIDVDSVEIFASSNVMLKNVDVGPIWHDTPNRGSSSGASPGVPRIWATAGGPPINIVVDGSFYHEINRTYWCDVNNACHPDGIYYNAGGPHTLRNSAFSQVAGEVFFIENFGGGADVNNMLVENNWFGCKVNSYPDSPLTARTTCGSGPPMDIKNCGTTCNGMIFRYNSWYGIGGAETSYTNLRFIGNAGAQPSNETLCSAGSWQYNAFWTKASGCAAAIAGTNFSTGSSLPSSLFVNTTAGSDDYHLTGAAGSTAAENIVTPTSSDYTVTTDMDGEARTAGSRDAGADER
jgi:hypothetical protein